MMRLLLAALLATAVAVPVAEAKKVRGAQTCDASKVDRTINGKTYSCRHCSNSICDETADGQLVNCGIEHTYDQCEEKAASLPGRTNVLQGTGTPTLDPGPKVRDKLKLNATPLPKALAPAE